MARHHLPFLACCTLLFACGNAGNDEFTDAYAGQGHSDMSELEARVAAITGQGLPAERSAHQAQEGSFPAQQDDQGGAMQQHQQTGQSQQVPPAQGGLRTHTIHNQQFNVPMAQLDLPARWNVRNVGGGWEGSAPGVTVKNLGGQSFMYATGQFAQHYQNAGGKMRAPVAPEQVVMQDLVPHLRKQGFELVGQRDAPAIAQADQRGLDGLYSIGQQRKTCRANISEWRKGDTRSAVVLHWYAFEGGDMTNWGYQMTGLETSAANYEQEKAALLSGLASLRYNPAYFAAYARSEQQKEQQSWGAHNTRMRNNQAAFDAQQQAHRDRVNSTNDAIMNNYWSNSASSDRQHAATIDMIRGEQNAWNPHNGQQGKVEAGYNNYWVNNDGQYFGTNDVMFDPNMHGQWVDQWQQMPTQP